MKDGIIKANGTSRRVQATFPATYEEFRAKAAAGTLSLDVLFQAAGWSQQPTFLNKTNLLDDTTAGLYGLGTDAVPNTVFGLLQNQQGRQPAYATDLYLYMTGCHPVLNAHQLAYESWYEVRHKNIKSALARTVSLTLTGEAETVSLTLYDGGAM